MKKIVVLTHPKYFIFAAISALVLIGLAPQALGESNLLNKPVDSQKITSQSERIAERKKQAKLELSGQAQEKIKTRCEAAQKKIADLKTKDTVSLDKYYQSYEATADQVSVMIQRLSKQAVSTAGIQTALNQYIDTANQFLVDADLYKAALADLKSMDCQADAEGFAASLKAGRDLRGKLSADAIAVKTKIDNLSASIIAAKDKL